MKRNFYDLYFFTIDTRIFKSVLDYDKEDIADIWYCADKHCSCGEKEMLDDFVKKGYKIKEISFWKKIKFRKDRVLVLLNIIQFLIILYLIFK